MKLSTKGRYGIRLMLDIALNSDNGPVALRHISKRQGISQKYLWHLINPLKNAGLIQATRGKLGGYTMAKPLAKISLREIVQVLEGPLSLVKCVERPGVCKRTPDCVARDVWYEVAEQIAQTLDAITLQDIVENYKKKTARSLVDML